MPDQLEHFEDALQVRHAGEVVVQIALLTTLYFKNAHLRKVQDKVMSCIEQYRRLVGNDLQWEKHPDTYKFYPIGSGEVPDPGTWLARRPGRAAWEFEWRGGDNPKAASAFSVKVLGREARGKDEYSFFLATFPLTWFTTHGGHFATVVLDFCERIRPDQGYGGIGILEAPDVEIASRYEPAVFALATRYPGLEADYPTTHILYIRGGIKGVNWLTVLGDQWIAALGGLPSLKTELGPDYPLSPYPGGVIIQAGPKPEIGDATKGAIPQFYARLSTVLKPIRITKHRMFHHGGPGRRFDRNASEAWLARFDQPPRSTG